MRNLKALGLALVAAFALSATMAAAASAEGVITADSPFVLDGVDKGDPSEHPLTAFDGTTECTHGTYTGGKIKGTDGEGHHETLTSPATEFTLTPQYTGCTAGSGAPEIVTMNGCDYEIAIQGTKEAGVYNTLADLVCPEGQEVTIDVYLSEESFTTPETPDCEIHVPPQGPLPGATLEDEGNGHLTLGGAVEEVELTFTAGPCTGGNHLTETEGELDLSVTLSGTEGATDTTPVGLDLSH